MPRLIIALIAVVSILLFITFIPQLEMFGYTIISKSNNGDRKVIRPVELIETSVTNALGEQEVSYRIKVNNVDVIYHSYEEFIGTTFVQYRLKTTSIRIKDIEYFEYLKEYEDALTEPKIFPLIREDGKKVMFGFVINGEFTKAMTLEEAIEYKTKLTYSIK